VKKSPNVWPKPIWGKIDAQLFPWKRGSPSIWTPSAIFRKMPNENSPNLGSMLWSQFSAIFDNFRQKNWRFSQNPML
jgi:hypothetical protein